MDSIIEKFYNDHNFLAELARDEKLNSDISVPPYCKIRTTKIDRSRVNFGELLFQFIARNKQLTFMFEVQFQENFPRNEFSRARTKNAEIGETHKFISGLKSAIK